MSNGDFNIFGDDGFDSEGTEPSVGFGLLNPGKYPVQIEKAEVRDTKAGTGQYLWFQFTVLDGPGKNQKLWAILNLQNPSEVAMKIARADLAAICRACDVVNPKHPDMLLGKWCWVQVKIKDGQNEINGYYHPNSNEISALGSDPYSNSVPKAGLPSPAAGTSQVAGPPIAGLPAGPACFTVPTGAGKAAPAAPAATVTPVAAQPIPGLKADTSGPTTVVPVIAAPGPPAMALPAAAPGPPVAAPTQLEGEAPWEKAQ